MDSEEILGIAVSNLANQFHRYMESKKAEIAVKIKEISSVTHVQGRIIEYLHRSIGKEPVYQKDLEKHFNIRRSTATIILQRMEKAGLIHRVVSQGDARMKEIALTERAIRFRPVAHEAIMEAEAQAKRGLTRQELETFFHVIKKITENIS